MVKKTKKLDRNQRILYLENYTRRHPELSANKIIQHIKHTDKGLRRKDALKIIRSVRQEQARWLYLKIARQKGITRKNRRRLTAQIKKYAKKKQYHKIEKIRKRLYDKRGIPIFEETD